MTIYSQPSCFPCKATYRFLDKHNVDYTVIDISEDADARAYVVSLGHQQTPVVVAGDAHWSGHSPTRLESLI